MADQKGNLIMRNTSGMIGKQIVFKQRGNKTYLAAPPKTQKRTPTADQVTRRQKFREASLYAKVAISDPGMKAAYAAAAIGNQSAYNVAFKDAYSGPQVMDIVTQGYLGQPGNLIVVNAVDDFKVNAVNVALFNSEGELIEEGAATPNEAGLIWTYITTVANPNYQGSTIRAVAFDIPENQGSLEVTV